MKKICLIVLFVLLLPVTSSFAYTPPTYTYTGQKILLPYAVADAGWWAGAAVHNLTNATITVTVGAYLSDGTYVSGNTFTVAAYAMKVDLVENYFSGMQPSGRMSVLFKCPANGSAPFKATLFIGNTQGGFGFNNYNSEAYDYTYTPPVVGPIIPDI
jgi:hypothetical protein